jgi:hypothetical protein
VGAPANMLIQLLEHGIYIFSVEDRLAGCVS